MLKQDRKYAAISAILGFVVLLLLGELVTRTLGATVVYEYDKTLGWRPKADFCASIPVTDQSGTTYPADYSTNEFGFRAFGDLSADKKRVLFVGDSWTGDPNTSDTEAYFGVVRENLPVEIFAIGGGGYGTLQELMLVQEFASKIEPDIFVLQYTDNDLINNSYDLEGPRITRAQKNFRPYWIDGELRYRLPKDSLYLFLHKHFRLFRTLDALLATAQYQFYDGYYPPPYQAYSGLESVDSFERQAEINTYRAAAISTTGTLMAKMKSALPSETQLVTFSASSDDADELAIWLSLAEQTGFKAYPSVSMKVEQAEANGAIVRVQDGAHWNRLGNRIAGAELSRLLARDFL